MKGSIWRLCLILPLTMGSLITMGAVCWKLPALDLMTSEVALKPTPSSSSLIDPEIPSSSASNQPIPEGAESLIPSSTTAEADHSAVPFYVPGEFLQLIPESPATVTMPGVIQGIVRLRNPHAGFWQVIIEATVTLADGTTHMVLKPRRLWMIPKQTIQRPVELHLDPQRFIPGLTEFRAILKDAQGKIIDQATITFMLTVDLP